MGKSKKLIASVILTAALIGSTVSQAAMMSKGMTGEDGYVLSKVTTYAGSGAFEMSDGEAMDASFRSPAGAVELSDGSIVISDSRNHVIRRIADGHVSTYAGFTLEVDELGFPLGGWHDGAADTAVFNLPSGLAVDGDDNVYVADAANHMIRKIDADGHVTTVAGDVVLGLEDARGEHARFNHPLDVAVAADGTLYVADTLNHAIRKIDKLGNVTTLNAPSERVVEVFPGVVEDAGDYADGPLAEAKFNEPSGLAIDSKGNLFVSDRGNQLIRYIDLDEGIVTTVAGLKRSEGKFYEDGQLFAAGGYVDGAAEEAQFFAPFGIAVSSEDGLLIADSLNHVIRYYVDGVVTTIAGSYEGEYGRLDGIDGYNAFDHPSGVTVLHDGSVAITDAYNNLVRLFELYHLPASLPLDKQVKVVLDDKLVVFDAQPELINGRVMVPVRALAEQLEYDVQYDFSGESKYVYLTKEGLSIELVIGDELVAVERDERDAINEQIDVAPYIKESRTYVPLRFFSEQIGMDVEWNQNNKTVIIRHVR